MLYHHLLSLVLLGLRTLNCAEAAANDTGAKDSELTESSTAVTGIPREQEGMPLASFSSEAATEDQSDKFRVLRNENLFSKILEFVAKSPGKMAMTSKRFRDLVETTKPLRFYSGAGWDMPELAEFRISDIKSIKDSEEIAAELNSITKLRHVTDEQSFNDSVYSSLVSSKRIKKLSKPVLKYLFRMLYDGKVEVTISAKYLIMKKNIYVYAARNGFYEVLFEMKTHLISLCLQNSFPIQLIDSNVMFDYYNWVYDNPRAHDAVMKRVAARTSADRLPISVSEISAYLSVCIHRKAPESYYLGEMGANYTRFYSWIRSYLIQYSRITLDPIEMASSHAFIKSLMANFLGRFPALKSYPSLNTELLNDFRFGPDDQNLNLIDIDNCNLEDLITAASRANKKELVRELSNHPKFNIRPLGRIVETRNPQSFKVYFDIIETNPNQMLNNRIFRETYGNSLSYLTDNKFKIVSATFLHDGIHLDIESPEEYVHLGFANGYAFIVETGNIERRFLLDLQSKMFNDAADSGEDEFEQLLTNFDTNFFINSRIIVSYKVVQLLLEKEERIQLLRNLNIQLYCDDLLDELMEGYEDIINPCDAGFNRFTGQNKCKHTSYIVLDFDFHGQDSSI